MKELSKNQRFALLHQVDLLDSLEKGMRRIDANFLIDEYDESIEYFGKVEAFLKKMKLHIINKYNISQISENMALKEKVRLLEIENANMKGFIHNKELLRDYEDMINELPF